MSRQYVWYRRRRDDIVVTGASGYSGSGDLGEVYVLAIERGLRAEVLPGAGGEATSRSVREAVGRLVGVRVSTLPLDQTRRVVPYADRIAGSSIRVGTARTRQLLDSVPTGPDIHQDIESGCYRTISPPYPFWLHPQAAT